jgi:tetratricopeptide (TPR) repeat protein
MIFAIAAAIAAAAPCPNVVTADAFVCRALVAQQAGDDNAAAGAFEQAALASSDKDPATARMWAAAGNMWIAANQPGKAALDLDKALALPGLDGTQRGEALLDRARAAEAQNDLVTARTKLNDAAPSISKDPFYWYFSAALYIREQNGQAAQAAIGQALSLAPADPTILFEAGHVAQFAGDTVGARDYWQRALARDPAGPIGKAAQEALRMLPAPLTVKSN